MSRFTSYLSVVLVFCGFFAGIARAENGRSDLQSAVDSVVAQQYESWAVKITSTYVSKDVRYFGGMPRDKPAVQTEIFLDEFVEKPGARPSGWHFGIWWSSGLQESEGVKTPSDEVDFTVGRTWKFEQGWWLTTDLLYFDVLPFNKSDGDVLVPRVKFGKDLDLGSAGKLKPYAQVECRFGLPDFVRRPTVTVGTDYVLPLGGPFSFKAGVSALYDCGIDGVVDTGETFAGRLGGEWKITKGLCLEIFVKEFGPHQKRDQQHQEVFGLVLTISR